MFSFFKKCVQTRWRRFVLFFLTLLSIGFISFPYWGPLVTIWYLDRYHQIMLSDLSFHFPLQIKAKTLSFQKKSPSKNITFIAKDIFISFSPTSLFRAHYSFQDISTQECSLSIFIYKPQGEVEIETPFRFPQLPSILIQNFKNENFSLNLSQVDSEGEMRSFRQQTAIHLKNMDLSQLSELQLKITENGEIQPGDPATKTQIDVFWKDFPIKPLLDFLGFPPEWSRYLKIQEGCQIKGKLTSIDSTSQKKEFSLEIAFRGVRFAETAHNFVLDLRWELEGFQPIQMIQSVLKTDSSNISVTHQTQDQYFIEFQLDPKEMTVPLETISFLATSPLRLLSPIKATAIYDLKDEELREIHLSIDSLQIYQHFVNKVSLTGLIQYEKNRAEILLQCEEIQGNFFEGHHIKFSAQELQLKNGGNSFFGKDILFQVEKFRIHLPDPLFASSLKGTLENISVENLETKTPRISYQQGKIELQPGLLHLAQKELPTPKGTLSISGVWEGAIPKTHSIRFEDGFSTLHFFQENTTIIVSQGDILLSPENLEALDIQMTPLSLTDSWFDWKTKKAYFKLSLAQLVLPQEMSFREIDFESSIDLQQPHPLHILSASVAEGPFTLKTVPQKEFLKVTLSGDIAHLSSYIPLQLPFTGRIQASIQKFPARLPLELQPLKEIILNPLEWNVELQEGQWKAGPSFSMECGLAYSQQKSAFFLNRFYYQDPSNRLDLSGTQTTSSQTLTFSKDSKIQLESLAPFLNLDLAGTLSLEKCSLQIPTQIAEWQALFQTPLTPKTLFMALPNLDLNLVFGLQKWTFEKKAIPLEEIKIHLRSEKNTLACPEFFVQASPWKLSGQVLPIHSFSDPLDFNLKFLKQEEIQATLQGTFERPKEHLFSLTCSGQYDPYPVTLQQFSVQIEKEEDTWHARIPHWNIETNVLGTLLESQGNLIFANQKLEGTLHVSTKTPYEGRIEGKLRFPFQYDLTQHKLSFPEIRLTLQGKGPFPELPFPPNGLDLQDHGEFLFLLEKGNVHLHPENFQGTFAVDKLTLQGKDARLFFQAFGLERPLENPKKEDYWTRPIAEWKNFHLQLFPWKGSFSPNHFLTDVSEAELRLFHKLKQWADICFSVGSIGIVDKSFEIPTPIEFITRGEIPLSQGYSVFQPIFEHILMRDLSGTLRVEAGKLTRGGIEVYPWLRQVKSRFSYYLDGDRHQLMIDEINGPAVYKCIWVKELPFQFWVTNRPGTLLQGKKVSYGIERKKRGKRRQSNDIEPKEETLPPLFLHLENLNLQLKEISMNGVEVENLNGQWAGGWFKIAPASFSWKSLILRVGGVLQQTSLKFFHKQTQFFSGILEGIVDGKFQLHIKFSPTDPKIETPQELWKLIDLDQTYLQLHTITSGEVRIDSLLEVPEGLDLTQRIGVSQFNNFHYEQILAQMQNKGELLHLIINKGNFSFEGTIPTTAFVRIANGTESVKLATVYWNWQKVTDLKGKFFVTFNNQEEVEQASPFLNRLFWGDSRSGSSMAKSLLELIPDNKELQHKFMLLLDTLTPFQQE